MIKGKRIISVGDIVSYSLIKAKINPDIIVFDKKVGRMPTRKEVEDALEKFNAKKLSVKNPPSHVTDNLWNVVKESLNFDGRVKIFVDGEEDLAVLPFILESPTGTIILYGFMGKGFVLVKVDKDLKKECKDLLSRMKRAGSSAW